MSAHIPPASSSVLDPADRQRLEGLFAHLRELAPYNVGYPCTQVFDYSELFPLLHFAANNVGDPFAGSNYRLNTHDFEREVLADFAKLTRAPENEWWGYVTA